MSRESGILLPVPEAEPAVSRWRERYDASVARGVAAHVTLLYPWRPAPVGEADLAALADALRGAPPFTLSFGDFGRFPRLLYLRPDDDREVRALMRRLFAAFPEHPPYGGMPPDDVIPHLTVADVQPDGDLEPVAARIEPDVRASLPITTRVTAVTVIEEGDDGRFAVRAVVPLGD